MEQRILEKLWQCELKVLDEIDRICKKHNIVYYLMWGTLIGAVRHKGFIPWDDDIDICMTIKNYKKFLKVAPKELNKEFFLQTTLTDPHSISYFARVRLNNTAYYAQNNVNSKMHHGFWVDIIPLQESNNPPSLKNKIARKFGDIFSSVLQNKENGIKFRYTFLNILPHKTLVKLRDFYYQRKGKYYTSYGYFFEKSLFADTVELEFCNKLYPAPKEYHKILSSVYGDYMQLPPPEKRITHNAVRINFDLTGPDEIIN